MKRLIFFSLGLSLYSYSAMAGIGAGDFVLPRNSGSPAQISSIGSDYVTTDGNHIPSDTVLDKLTASESGQYLIRKSADARNAAPEWVIVPVRNKLSNPNYHDALVAYDLAPVKGYSRVVAANMLWGPNSKFVDPSELATEIHNAPEGVRVELPLSTVIKMADAANKSFEFEELEKVVAELQVRPNYLETEFAKTNANLLLSMVKDTPYSERLVEMIKTPNTPLLRTGLDAVSEVQKAATESTVRK